MDEQQRRIADLEARLARVEAQLAIARTAAPAPATLAAAATPAASAGKAAPPLARKPAARDDASLIGNVLGWGGALALVLAASYLIRLAIDSGWLTPLRQVSFAAIFGIVLVAAGFFLRGRMRNYAGLLPAAGVAILFLTIYGGHLYHHLIGLKEAGVAVMLVCAASLWLCRAFESDLYALFAVAGSYSAPFLLSNPAGSLTDLAIYFSAWGVVFSVFAIWHGRRLVYLLALYLALIGFDFAARGRATELWQAVMAFQAGQFFIFGLATALFSVRNESPLSPRDGMAHLPPLLLFYFLQYSLLHQHLPAYAAWIAVGSLAAVAALYGGARALLQRPLPGGEFLLWAYAALVLFHAGYVESVPHQWAPWFALALVPAMALVALRHSNAGDEDEQGLGPLWPMWLAVGIIFAINYLRIIFDTDLKTVPGRPLLALAYAALLYLGYWFFRRNDADGKSNTTVKVLLIYAGHLSAMAAALRFLNEHIIESAAWGLLAVACLVLSLQSRDKLLGQSSLAVFGATAGKVLLYDLSGASPVARIIGLVVLGVTFYAGGMLYQRLLVKAPAPQ